MTTQSKHTPGPWAVDAPHQVWAEAAGEYVAITQVEDWETVPREQVEANARLIAAAPALLEALKLCLPYVRAAMQSAGGMAEYEAELAAEAAIAKAEGEQE